MSIACGNVARGGEDDEYNTDVVAATLDVVIGGTATTTVNAGPSYAWDDFDPVVVPVEISDDRCTITVRGTGVQAPSVDGWRLSPLVLGSAVQ